MNPQFAGDCLKPFPNTAILRADSIPMFPLELVGTWLLDHLTNGYRPA